MSDITEITKSVVSETRSKYNLKGVDANQLFTESKKAIENHNKQCSECGKSISESNRDFIIRLKHPNGEIIHNNMELVCEDDYSSSDSGVSQVSNTVSSKSHILNTVNKWDDYFQRTTPHNFLPSTLLTIVKSIYLFFIAIFVLEILSLLIDGLPVSGSMVMEYIGVAFGFSSDIFSQYSFIILGIVVPAFVVFFTILKIYEPVTYQPPKYSLEVRYKVVPVMYTMFASIWLSISYVHQTTAVQVSETALALVGTVSGVSALLLITVIPFSFREYLRVDRDTNYALSVAARSAKVAAEDGRTVLTGNSSEIGSVQNKDVKEVLQNNYDLVATEYLGVTWMTLLNLSVAFVYIRLASAIGLLPFTISYWLSMIIFASPIAIFTTFVLWRRKVKKNLDAQLVEAKQTAEQQSP